MVRTETDPIIKADDTYTYNNSEYKSYFDYWLWNSENVCECCVHNSDLSCDDCEHFYKLTEEECKERNLPYNLIGKDYMWYFPKEGWTCRNTDNFEFCYKYQHSICKDCMPFDRNEYITEIFPKFKGNGLIK